MSVLEEEQTECVGRQSDPGASCYPSRGSGKEQLVLLWPAGSHSASADFQLQLHHMMQRPSPRLGVTSFFLLLFPAEFPNKNTDLKESVQITTNLAVNVVAILGRYNAGSPLHCQTQRSSVLHQLQTNANAISQLIFLHRVWVLSGDPGPAMSWYYG